ncbi:MAG: hypothetical protein FWJ87_15905 [Micromonosporaceae bacterium]|jgi:hypothetical protein|nr:hypothetical protein [Natronosporangium sp.]
MTGRFRLLAVWALATATIGALVACDSGPGREGDVGNGAEPDQALVEEALEFGRIVLPPSAVVLGAETEKGIDLLYCLAVRVAPGDVDRMLSDSGFTAELEPGRQVFMPTVAGVELGNADRIASAQDTIRSGNGAERYVSRVVLVDRTDPDAPVVHLWLFTT